MLRRLKIQLPHSSGSPNALKISFKIVAEL